VIRMRKMVNAHKILAGKPQKKIRFLVYVRRLFQVNRLCSVEWYDSFYCQIGKYVKGNGCDLFQRTAGTLLW
jgi:hypothetical protein